MKQHKRFVLFADNWQNNGLDKQTFPSTDPLLHLFKGSGYFTLFVYICPLRMLAGKLNGSGKKSYQPCGTFC